MTFELNLIRAWQRGSPLDLYSLVEDLESTPYHAAGDLVYTHPNGYTLRITAHTKEAELWLMLNLPASARQLP